MARTIQITDGSTTVSLLDSSGFQLLLDRWPMSEPTAREIWSSSYFADGRWPSLRAANNARETLGLKLNTTSQDNAAENIQKLTKLLRKARNYHMTEWQQTPVYLQVQLSDETNTRYSLLYDGRLDFNTSLDDATYSGSKLVRDITLTLEREPSWRSHAPESLPSPLVITAPQGFAFIDLTEHFVSNYRGLATLSKIYAYDADLAAFSGDLSGLTSFNYFEVSGSTPAVGDIMYFGSTTPWFHAVIRIGTAFVGSGVTLVCEYWNGAWTTGGDVSRELCEDEDTITTGLMTMSFRGATDWTTTAVNSQTLYWFRLRISAVTTWTTSPAQAGQPVYAVTDTYIEIANTKIAGDLPATPLIRFNNHSSDPTNVIGHVILGGKSRGLTNFTSRLNCGADAINPGDWTITMGTDTANATDERGPDGEIAQCTFGTNQALTERWKITNTNVSEIADFEGIYHVFARVEQSGGVVGDVSVRFKLDYQHTTWTSRTETLTKVDSGPEVVSFGRFSILSAGIKSGEQAFGNLFFRIEAQSDNGTTPNLNLFDLVLIPVDEWAIVAAETTEVTNSAIQGRYLVDIDSGIMRTGSTVKMMGFSGNSKVIIPIETRGVLPELEPARQMRIYALFYSGGIGSNDMGGGIEIYTHERWLFLRGAD